MALEDRRAHQEACNRCSQCKFVPMPESMDFASICPSIDYGNFHAYSAGGKIATGYMLMEGRAPVSPKVIESIYACTMCGGCDIACKTNMGDEVEPLGTLYELRAHMVRKGHVPDAIGKMVEQLRREGSHLGLRSERSLWAEGLGLKDAVREKVDVLLHIDGENAFDRGQWPQLTVLIALLRAADLDFGIAYDAENDSGALAYDLGFQDDARAFAVHQKRLLQQCGASVLLTASASAFAAFHGLYPRLGVSLGDVRIVHSTELVADLVSTGRVKLSATRPITATYHDPCRLGRLSESFEPWSGELRKVLNTLVVPEPARPQRFGAGGQYEAPRQLLQALEGLELVEMQRNREFAFCCGAGSGVPQAYPEMADMAAVNRLREAQETGASYVVTACAGCQAHLSRTASAHGIDLKVRGIFDLLADALPKE